MCLHIALPEPSIKNEKFNIQLEEELIVHDVTLDAADLRLLDHLQRHGRASNVELAEVVHLSPSQVHRRLRRLEGEGVVGGYAALLDAERLGLQVNALVNLTLEKQGGDPVRALQALVAGEPRILECWAVSGEADYVLRVVAADLKGFSDFLLQTLLGRPFIAAVKSTILLQRLKATTVLPLPR